MKRTLLILTALALLTIPAMSRARYIVVTDSIIPERIIVRSSQLGFTMLNNLDTYLSNYNHKGFGVNFNHETFRNARTGSYRWKYQTIFNVTAGYAIQGGNIQYTGLISQSWGGYHPFRVAKGLTLLAGGQMQFEIGALYNPAGGNSPAAAKLRTTFAASGMAIYHFPVRRSEWIARYQVDIPLIGAMFAPEFGQSYYEIFGLGHARNVVAFTHPLNNPSMRHTLSLDIPVGRKHHSTTLRLSYIADLYQSRINSIDCHIYRHTFSVGFTRTIFKVKKENILNIHSPY